MRLERLRITLAVDTDDEPKVASAAGLHTGECIRPGGWWRVEPQAMAPLCWGSSGRTGGIRLLTGTTPSCPPFY